MPWITLTANPVWEVTWTVPTLTAGLTVRANGETCQLGGKGINVAKVLRRLGGTSCAWLVAGGDLGEKASAWLRAQGVEHRVIPREEETRLGLVIRDAKGLETTVLGPDRALLAATFRDLARAIDDLPAGSRLAVCGSVPGFDQLRAQDFLDALGRFGDRSKLVIDSYGDFLSSAAHLPLELVKVNRSELTGLLASESLAPERLLRLACTRYPRVRTWCVTDGPLGAWMLESASGRISSSVPEPVACPSATGAGDAFLAALLSSESKGGPWSESLPWAVAVARAKVLSNLTTDFPLP